MAAHLRSQLRQALVDLLVNQINADGDVVAMYRHRAHTISENKLPAAFIAVNGEDASSDSKRRPFINDLAIEFEIELCIKDDTDADDVIDDACRQIQHAIANAVLPGTKWVRYTGTRIYADEENHGVMRADLRFTAFLMAYENAVDVAL